MLRREESERQRFRIQEPIRDVLHLVSRELVAQGVSVQEELDPDLPPVEADRIETQQVVMNLLVNAVHALSELPTERRQIRVRTERHGDEVVKVTIEDAGPGIAPEELSTVVEPFFTTRSGSLGMGLAICRPIVEAHGSRIWGENTGDGARLSFNLPLAKPDHTND